MIQDRTGGDSQGWKDRSGMYEGRFVVLSARFSLVSRRFLRNPALRVSCAVFFISLSLTKQIIFMYKIYERTDNWKLQVRIF